MSQSNKKYTILCVDDEPRITSALKALFRREYTVLVANSGQEALDLLQDNNVNVLISDQRMPGMLGSDLIAKVSHLCPQTIRILLTGFMDRQAIVDSINEGEVYRFINKPWDNFEIAEVVAEAAAASELPAGTVFLGDGTVVQGGEDDAFISATRGKAIVLIGRDQGVRNQIRRFCTQRDIMVYSTQNVEQAVTAATTRDNVGVVVAELTGDEHTLQTINLLKQSRPELVAITLTQEYDADTAVDLINQGQVFKYLSSPISDEDLHNTINMAFRRHLYLKDNSASWRRYKVENLSGRVAAGLQGLFGRLLGAAS